MKAAEDFHPGKGGDDDVVSEPDSADAGSGEKQNQPQAPQGLGLNIFKKDKANKRKRK